MRFPSGLKASIVELEDGSGIARPVGVCFFVGAIIDEIDVKGLPAILSSTIYPEIRDSDVGDQASRAGMTLLSLLYDSEGKVKGMDRARRVPRILDRSWPRLLIILSGSSIQNIKPRHSPGEIRTIPLETKF